MRAFVHSPDADTPLHDLGEIDPERRFVDLVDLEVDEHLWLENEEDPLDVSVQVRTVVVITEVLRLHRHRHRQIEVVVRYNGRSESRKFAPSATIDRVTRQATQRFGIDPAEAADLVLRRQGSQEDLDPEDHIGTLAGPHGHVVRLDLVPAGRFAG